MGVVVSRRPPLSPIPPTATADSEGTAGPSSRRPRLRPTTWRPALVPTVETGTYKVGRGRSVRDDFRGTIPPPPGTLAFDAPATGHIEEDGGPRLVCGRAGGGQDLSLQSGGARRRQGHDVEPHAVGEFTMPTGPSFPARRRRTRTRATADTTPSSSSRRPRPVRTTCRRPETEMACGAWLTTISFSYT